MLINPARSDNAPARFAKRRRHTNQVQDQREAATIPKELLSQDQAAIEGGTKGGNMEQIMTEREKMQKAALQYVERFVGDWTFASDEVKAGFFGDFALEMVEAEQKRIGQFICQRCWHREDPPQEEIKF